MLLLLAGKRRHDATAAGPVNQTVKLHLQVEFTVDKKRKKPHYQVWHGDINEQEFEEVFSQPVVVIGQKDPVLKVVGRTVRGRFSTVVFIRRIGDHYHIITAWPSKKQQILLWHREMKQ